MTVPHTASAVRRFPGIHAVAHRFELPLAPGEQQTIEVFAREIRAAASADETKPYLLVLNGGPGMPARRPTDAGGWLKAPLEHYRLLLLDQRGTGLSTPVSAEALPSAAALAHYRADAIVRDAEAIRRTLLGEDGRWSIIGQSFGGFTAVTYLSFAPEHLDAAFITGGLPPLDRPAIDVYRATSKRLDARLALYLDRYPEDRATWEAVTASEPRFKELGNPLGMSDGPEHLHYLAEHARASNLVFLEKARHELSYTANPLYAVLHEAIYAQGEATRWAARRALDERGDDPLLYGEMILPSYFASDPTLQPFRAVAEELAEYAGWPPLYDPEQLARNEVPAVAAVYLDDMYVEAEYSRETAGAINGLAPWVTNEFQHDGLYDPKVFKRLLAMLRGEA